MVNPVNQVGGRSFLIQRRPDPKCLACWKQAFFLAGLCNDEDRGIKVAPQDWFAQIIFTLCPATLLASVRVNRPDRRSSKLVKSDACNPGALHGYIFNEGKVRLGVAGPKGRGHADYDSPVDFTPERLGQRVQLAVVHGAAAKQVTH